MKSQLDTRPDISASPPAGGTPLTARAGVTAAWWAAAVLFVLGGVATAIGGWFRWFGGNLDLVQRQDDGADPFTGTRYVIEGSTEWSVVGWSLIALGMIALAIAIARDRGWGGAKGHVLAVAAALTGVFAFVTGPLSWALGQSGLPSGIPGTLVVVLSAPWLLGIAPVVLVGVAFSAVRGRTSGPAMGWALVPLLLSALIVEFVVLLTAEDIITANPSHDDPFGAGILMGSAVALTGALIAARLARGAGAETAERPERAHRPIALGRAWPALGAAVAFGVLAVNRVVVGLANSTEHLMAGTEDPSDGVPVWVHAALVLAAWTCLLLWRWGVAGRLLVLVAGAMPVFSSIAWAIESGADGIPEYDGWIRLLEMTSSGIGVMIPWLILAMAAAVTPRRRGSRALLAWALAAAASAVLASYAFGAGLEPFAAVVPTVLAAAGCAHVAWVARHREATGAAVSASSA